MGRRKSNREIEVKIAVENLVHIKRLLARHGFCVARRRVFERNQLFDTPTHSLRGQGKLLRIRQAGTRSVLTFKGPGIAGKHKSREELEIELPRQNPMAAILENTGFKPDFVYEKYRTEYQQPPSAGVITLDETPIGFFLELEGSPRWIDKTARTLGFAESQYITKSYGALYLEYCNRARVKPSNMLFKETV